MRRVFMLLLVLSFMAYVPSMSFGFPYLVVEPDITSRTMWDINSAGLLVVGYDLNGDGKADYYTLRPVIASFYSAQHITVITRSFPNCPIFTVGYSGDAYYYVVAEHPLLYAIDLNGDDVWDLIYKDVLADGVNGNEKFYDSPSGMFTADVMNY